MVTVSGGSAAIPPENVGKTGCHPGMHVLESRHLEGKITFVYIQEDEEYV